MAQVRPRGASRAKKVSRVGHHKDDDSRKHNQNSHQEENSRVKGRAAVEVGGHAAPLLHGNQEHFAKVRKPERTRQQPAPNTPLGQKGHDPGDRQAGQTKGFTKEDRLAPRDVAFQGATGHNEHSGVEHGADHNSKKPMK